MPIITVTGRAILTVLSDRPFSIHPRLARELGFTAAGFVSYLLDRGAFDNWKAITRLQIESDLGLSIYEQVTVRKTLKKRGLLHEQRTGHPPVLHYKLDESLADLVVGIYGNIGKAPITISNVEKINITSDIEPDIPPQTILENSTLPPIIDPIDLIENLPITDQQEINPETTTSILCHASRDTRARNTATPAAVKVFRSETHRYPSKSWFPDIASAVGESPADLEFWREIIHAWLGLGWNPVNVRGMLECYGRREVPHSNGKYKIVQEEEIIDHAKGTERCPTDPAVVAWFRERRVAPVGARTSTTGRNMPSLPGHGGGP